MATIDSYKQQVSLNISHVAYNTLDTLVDLTNIENLNVVLTENPLVIDGVTITAQQGLFDDKKWRLKHIIPHELGFIAIAREKRKDVVYLFDDNGTVFIKKVWDEKITSLYKGLTPGKYHLIGKDYGHEIIATTDDIIHINTKDIDKYTDMIYHFRHVNAHYSIIENWQMHNKHLRIEKIDNKTIDKTLIYRVLDMKLHANAQKVYDEVIALYQYYIQNDDPTSIDAGMAKNNIVADRSWEGDLRDLVINNHIQEVYHEYKSLLDFKLEVSITKSGDHLYVLDNSASELLSITLSQPTASINDSIVKLPDGMKKAKFIYTEDENILYIEASGNYYRYNISTGKWQNINIEPCGCSYPTSTFVKNGKKYV